MNPRTIPQVLREAVDLYGNAIALHQPIAEKGGRQYQTYTWPEYLRAVEEIAAGLRALGIGKGDIVALSSETRAEFYLADIGIMANGSISAALYSNYPPHESVRTIQACDAKAVFVEDQKAFHELRDAPVSHWILLTGHAEGALSLEQLREKGREALVADPALPARLVSELKPEDDAILYLTSGATGEPKMVMVSHGAVVANLDMGPVALPLTPHDATVAFLPSAHIAQRIVIELLPIRMGTPVWFAESLLKLPQDIRSVRPTVLLAPPRMWERIYTTISTEVRKRPPAARKLFHGALGLGLKAHAYRQANKTVPLWMRAPLKLADRLVFRKIRDRFGGRLRIAASGAAPLSKDLAEFYGAIGMPLVEGYGLTEGGVAVFNPLDRPRSGSIGKALPGVDMRLGEDGELLINSPCLFSRYYKDPAATAEVLRDKWLHTGDIGEIDSQGYIFITGRKKELIVSSTGKKIYPSRVENLFKLEPLISQVLLVGDRLPYLAALFTINADVAKTLKGMEGWNGASGNIVSAAPVAAEVQKAVKRVNQQLAQFEQIRKHRILCRDFTIEEGELTATMKVRRARVIENFREDIEELYAGRE